MRLLLDTHALVWWAINPNMLSTAARDAIRNADNDVVVSAISAMEIATKVRLGKFDEAIPLATGFAWQMTSRGLKVLAVTAEHGERAGNLVTVHKDPWDRLLVAQAQIEDLILVTKDAKLGSFEISLLW